MKQLIAICCLVVYSTFATAYAIPEVKRRVALWGFNERMLEAAQAKQDTEKAKQAGVVDETLIRALGG